MLPHGCREAKMPSGEDGTSLEDSLSRRHILAHSTDILPAAWCDMNLNAPIHQGGLFLHHYSVCFGWDRSPGEDPNSLSRCETLRWGSAGGNGSDDLEPGVGGVMRRRNVAVCAVTPATATDVLCPNGEAIHRAVVPGRKRCLGGHPVEEHPPEGGIQIHHLGFRSRGGRQAAPEGLVDRQHITSES